MTSLALGRICCLYCTRFGITVTSSCPCYRSVLTVACKDWRLSRSDLTLTFARRMVPLTRTFVRKMVLRTRTVWSCATFKPVLALLFPILSTCPQLHLDCRLQAFHSSFHESSTVATPCCKLSASPALTLFKFR